MGREAATIQFTVPLSPASQRASPKMPSGRTTRCASCTTNPNWRPYITMWNTISKRKVAGTAAPCAPELAAYLLRHPHIVVYQGQDGGTEGRKEKIRKRDRDRDKERRRRQRAKQQRENGHTHDVNGDNGESLVRERCSKRDNAGVSENDNMTSATVGTRAQSEDLTKSDVCGGQEKHQVHMPTSPGRRVALIHPFAHIALAQRIWTVEAHSARGLDSGEEQMKVLLLEPDHDLQE